MFAESDVSCEVKAYRKNNNSKSFTSVLIKIQQPSQQLFLRLKIISKATTSTYRESSGHTLVLRSISVQKRFWFLFVHFSFTHHRHRHCSKLSEQQIYVVRNFLLIINIRDFAWSFFRSTAMPHYRWFHELSPWKTRSKREPFVSVVVGITSRFIVKSVRTLERNFTVLLQLAENVLWKILSSWFLVN